MFSPRWIFGFSINASNASRADPGTTGISSPGNSYLSKVSRTSNSTNSKSSLSSTWSSLFKKTTIFGLLAAISGYFATAGTGKVQIIAQAIAGLSTFLLGGVAADSKKDN